jgi:hypothetical protein
MALSIIAPFSTEKTKSIKKKSSLRHWHQLLNLFFAPLPTAVCSKKAVERAVCAIGS